MNQSQRTAKTPDTGHDEGVFLRRAEPRDTDSVTQLVAEAFAIYTPLIGKPPAPALYDYARMIDTGLVSVACEGAVILGVLYIYKQTDGAVMLDVLAISHVARGRGIARMLTAYAEARARDMGAHELRVYTNAVMEGPLKVYPRLGFVETHRGESDGYLRVHFAKPL